MANPTLVFLAGKRTPFGAYGGSLKDVNPTDWRSSLQGGVGASKVDPKEIDHVIFGNVIHSAPDSIYSPRHIGLQARRPRADPGARESIVFVELDFRSMVEAYHQMLAGDTKIALVGGVENMSMSPYVLRGARWGMQMGHSR